MRDAIRWCKCKLKPPKNISNTEVEHLKHMIKRMGGPLTESHDGVNLCIADHYKMAKKEPTPTTKKLLLSSGQNGVAESIKRYTCLHYQSRIMKVRNYDQFF